MSKIASLVIAAILAASAVFAGETPSFSTKPTAKKAGEKIAISFAVKAPTDVEVSVLDATGRIVRHLAAGLLGGEKAPPAPLEPGLRQELEWDMRTDAGKPAEGGPFKVQVRLGVGFELDGFIGENRHHIGSVFGLATDDAGCVYVCSASTGNKGPDGTVYLLKYDRTGKYLKTLMPMAADLPRERLKGFNLIPAPGEHIVPRNYNDNWPVFYRGPGALAPRVPADGTLTFFDWSRLSRLAADGGCAGDTFGREVWAKGQKPPTPVWRWKLVRNPNVAVSPDGKYAYLSGLRDKKPGGKYPAERIYRLAVAGGALEKFADVAGGAAVSGMCFDKDGNLLVCAGSRVAVLDSSGKEIGEIKVADPRYVACHRKTGAVYVVTAKKSGWWRAKKSVLAFSGWKNAAEQARLELRELGYNAHMALDDTGKKPVLWVAVDRTKGRSGYNPGAPSQLLRLEHVGGKLVETEHPIGYKGDPMGVVTRLAVHPETETIVSRGEYSEAAGWNGNTGERVKLPFKHTPDMAVGLDGNWYVMEGNHWQGPVTRYDRDFKPIPTSSDFSKARRGFKNAVGWAFQRYGKGIGVGGLAADINGRVYSLQMTNLRTNSGDCVVVFGPDGKPEDPGRMKGDKRFLDHGQKSKQPRFTSAIFGPIEITVVGNVAVDWNGFIYVSLRCYPVGHKAPPGFEKDPAYWTCTGSVIKVKPEGGSYFFIDGPEARPPRKKKPPEGMPGVTMTRLGPGWPTGPGFCENGLVVYPDIGSMSGGFPGCHCRQPMFALDGWGRVFAPNALTYAVRVYDNAGAEILKFGHYGNADSRGTGEDSPVRKPAVPLGWPEAVAASDRALYVADVLNRRIVRMKKTYGATETCAVQ